jgi:hypothetical protein
MKALGLLMQTLFNEEHRQLIKGVTTCKEAYDRIVIAFHKDDSQRQQVGHNYVTKLHEAPALTEGGDIGIRDYVNKLKFYYDRSIDNGEEISEKTLAHIILARLPPSLQHIKLQHIKGPVDLTAFLLDLDNPGLTQPFYEKAKALLLESLASSSKKTSTI